MLEDEVEEVEVQSKVEVVVILEDTQVGDALFDAKVEVDVELYVAPFLEESEECEEVDAREEG